LNLYYLDHQTRLLLRLLLLHPEYPALRNFLRTQKNRSILGHPALLMHQLALVDHLYPVHQWLPQVLESQLLQNYQ